MATQIYGNGTTTASAGVNTVIHHYDRAGIEAANAVNVYQQFASAKQMPTNSGKTYKISKFLKMYDRDQFESNGTVKADFAKYGYLTGRALADVQAGLTASALAEGAGAVNQKGIKKITVEATVNRYGEMTEYSDEVDLFSEDIIQARYRESLGELANRRWEDLLQLDMLATPTRMYSGVATSRATVGGSVSADGTDDAEAMISYDLVRAATRKLTANRASKNTELVKGSVKIDTMTVGKAYYAIIGSDVKKDMENLTRGSSYEKEFVWKPVQKYADASMLADGEVGSMYDVRFIESEAAVVYRQAGATVPTSYAGNLQYTGIIGTDAKFDVFPVLFPTKDAFATVGLKGKGKITFNSAGPAEVSIVNPYGTKGFFSYNFFYAGIILEPEKLLVIEVASSK
jgi:N4-gp56 family major capsid protein